MRAVIKRVKSAEVTIKSDSVASIGRGLCVLVGLHKDDAESDIDYMVKEILNTKFFSTNEEDCDRTVVEEGLDVLCVHQDFLYAVVRSGDKLAYPDAMSEDKAEKFYAKFLAALKNGYEGERIKSGTSGDYMQVHVENEVFMTIMRDSREK